MSTFWIIVITLIVGFIISEAKSKSNENESIIAQNSLENCMQYNEENSTLTVHARNPHFKKVFYIEDYKGTNYGYEEEKYVYTGATVGGVTMGGIHKTGGNYAEGYKTSKVQLFYHYFNKEKKIYENSIIKRIELLDESLVKQAKNSSIKKYLIDNYFVIEEKEDTQKLNNAIMTASRIGDNNMALNFMNAAKVETLSTKEKCTEIINWLSSND